MSILKIRKDGSDDSRFNLSNDIVKSSIQKRNRASLALLVSLVLAAGVLALSGLAAPGLSALQHNGISTVRVSEHNFADLCPQSEPLSPTTHAELFQKVDNIYHNQDFRLHAYESLGGAIRVPTETFDEVGPVGEDPHWRKFAPLHDYLLARFPLIRMNLELTNVSGVALVFHWQGSNRSLKPTLLTAHQDVVPVHPDTTDLWENPPFSGYFDGEWIWGRGSCDDKSGLISILTTMETLLDVGFKPSPTIVLAFGADEERGGKTSGAALGKFLLQTYGKDAFAILIDEGSGYSEDSGAIFASPNVAEKGKLDVKMEVSTRGGHSSIPPLHTGIGILAAAITRLEDNPIVAHLQRNSTFYSQLLCLASHAPAMDVKIKGLILKSMNSDDALWELEELFSLMPSFKAQLGTTQAVDLIGGGIKSNALPEKAWTIVNHRVSQLSSLRELQQRWIDMVLPVASRFNLSLSAFGGDVTGGFGVSSGLFNLTDAYGTGLEPAPVSPTFGSTPWNVLAGTIRASLTTSKRKHLRQLPVFITPGVSLGNTDTRHYWDLTRYIFRYGHLGRLDLMNGAHTVNEAVRAEGFLEMIRFHTRLIINLDEAQLA